MTAKLTNILYWTFTLPFALFMTFGGVSEIIHHASGVAIMQHLGYPEHVLTVLGLGKLLGAVALLQPWWRTLKEWAYAGFTFNLLGAFAARYAAHDGFWLVVSPLLFLAFMAVGYLLWHRRLREQGSDEPATRPSALTLATV